ncbi:hypothetical protein KU306_02560 [Haloferax larsenii]|uniref:Lipoprotein n=1 Tax=Haloferax larsenii TaxID=302484 RepID=A0ABY5RGW2_HALLR|nr:hypothetical protein [Haloferax larsenii]ELZ79570.1 hypothetical protein C455_08297 [Haloferax larsenii JCM 13917]UVE50790.1 hypothetical protein KU306_02560 [Haloferax larsenii]
MNRRSLLASIGATTTALTAGCISSLEETLGPSVRLGWFGVHNIDTEPHEFDLLVIRDGTEVHYSSHDVRGRTGSFNDGAVADCDWGDVPGDYEVAVRVDDGDWNERSVTSRDADCVVANAQYLDDSEPSKYRDGHSLTISVIEECNPDHYDRMCSFVTR